MKTKFDINVKWEDDTDADLSWLGEYKSSRPNTLYVDRKNEVLINPNDLMDKEFDNEELYDEYIDELDNFEIPYDGYEDEDIDGNLYWVVNHPYWDELPFSCTYGRNSYQFIESMNYQTATKNEYQYFVNDVKRLEKFGNDWFMQGCIITVSLDGIELGQDSLWGLESDMDEVNKQSVIDDLTFEALNQAKQKLPDLKLVEVE